MSDIEPNLPFSPIEDAAHTFLAIADEITEDPKALEAGVGAIPHDSGFSAKLDRLSVMGAEAMTALDLAGAELPSGEVLDEATQKNGQQIDAMTAFYEGAGLHPQLARRMAILGQIKGLSSSIRSTIERKEE